MNTPDKVQLAPSVPRKCPECGDLLVIIAYSDMKTYYNVHDDGTAMLDEVVAGKHDDTIILSCTNCLCRYERNLHTKDGVLDIISIRGSARIWR